MKSCIKVGVSAVFILLSWSGIPVAAEIGFNPDEALSNSVYTGKLKISQGCNKMHTTGMVVHIPNLGPNYPILNVKPEQIAGWTITTQKRKLPKPVLLDGNMVTHAISSIRYIGFLPDNEELTLYREFGISFHLPQFEEDWIVPFNVTQTCACGTSSSGCVDGRNMWNGESPNRPAVKLTVMREKKKDVKRAIVVDDAYEYDDDNVIIMDSVDKIDNVITMDPVDQNYAVVLIGDPFDGETTTTVNQPTFPTTVNQPTFSKKAYRTKEAAQTAASLMGCSGAHIEHLWMPGNDYNSCTMVRQVSTTGK